MHGLVHVLKLKTNGGWVRRVVVQETVQLPAGGQTDVAGRVVYKDLKNPWVTWTSVQGAPVEEVRVARTILSPSCKGVAVRVMNLARYQVTLRQGMVLGELEPVEVVKNWPGEAMGPEIHVESGLPVYVQTLLEGVDPSVPLEARQRLTELLVEHAPVFSQGDGDLERANAVKHRIDTGPHRPLRQVLRRQPNAYLDVIDGEINEMMAHGLLEPASSEWASNVVMVQKGDRTLRFCVDYRQLNERTRTDFYPLSRIDVCLDALAGAEWFLPSTYGRDTIR